MNKLIAGLAILAPFVAAGAQDFSRADVFGGYSLERIAVCGHTNNACGVESGDLPPTMNLSGWEVAPTFHFSKTLGITADFAGHFVQLAPDTSTSRFSYLFGPTVAFPGEKATPFAHVLAGAVHQGVFNTNGFNLAAGGGLDYVIARHFAIRVVQLDYDLARVPKTSTNAVSAFANGFRYAAGIVIK